VIDTAAPHVLIATGSAWRASGRGRSHPAGIPGAAADPRTLTPDQVLEGARPAGPVVIFDDEGYHIAAGLADLLASEGQTVTYVTPAGLVADWAGYTVEQAGLQARLIERAVTIITAHSVAALGPGTATLACVFTGRRHDVACGGFIPVTSREPQDDLWHALQDKGLQSLHRIGDARAPGLIAHAVHDGHRAARAHLTPLPPPRRERVILPRVTHV
jgi:dimethylamine/trimethylamine dehydrogenase